jgi:hypothetical protein
LLAYASTDVEMAVTLTAIGVMENGVGVGAEANSPTVSLHFRRRGLANIATSAASSAVADD